MSRFTASALLLTLSLAALTRLSAQETAPVIAPEPAPVVITPAAVPAPDKESTPGTDPVPAQSGPELTLQECVNRALAKNFSLRAQGFNSLNAKEDLIISKANFDPVLYATTSRAHNQGVTTFNDNLGTTTSTNSGRTRPTPASGSPTTSSPVAP